jgi:hypothetical protein
MNLFSSNISRRTVLRMGALGAGLALPEFLRLEAAGGVDKAKVRSGILVFLKGGPSHMDTFDLKPEAPREYRGDFRPRKTNVPGVEICEHLPRLARCADQFAVVRGLTHNLAVHGLGSRYLLTGNRPLPTLQFPTFGSVLSRVAPGADDLPSFVGVDEAIEGAGYLGAQYSALNTGEFPRANQPFNVRGLSLDGIDLAQFRQRRGLLDKIDNEFRVLEKKRRDPARARRFFAAGLSHHQLATRAGGVRFGTSRPRPRPAIWRTHARPHDAAGLALGGGGRAVCHRRHRRLGHA